MDGPREFPLPALESSTPLPDDLPVAGGRGYTKEEVCIILDDEVSEDDGEVHGKSHAGSMISLRLQKELDAICWIRFLSEIAMILTPARPWHANTPSCPSESKGSFSACRCGSSSKMSAWR